MLFDYDLTIPAATQQNAPVAASCHLSSGILNRIRVKFPPGPATLVHVVVKDALFQLMPLNPDGDLNFDDENIDSGVLDYPLQAPYDLHVYGWSPLAIFEHTITVQFDVQPPTPDKWSDFVQQLTGISGKVQTR